MNEPNHLNDEPRDLDLSSLTCDEFAAFFFAREVFTPSVGSAPRPASRQLLRNHPPPPADILPRGMHRGSAAALAAPVSLRSTPHPEREYPARAARLACIC